MSTEKFPHFESEFEKVRKIKETEGWHLAGQEKLTETKFSKEAKFEQVLYQTEDEIRTRYLMQAYQQNPTTDFEIELTLDENTDKLRRLRLAVTDEEYRSIIENLNPSDKQYLVWLKKIEK